jgi:hypothetical protein
MLVMASTMEDNESDHAPMMRRIVGSNRDKPPYSRPNIPSYDSLLISIINLSSLLSTPII